MNFVKRSRPRGIIVVAFLMILFGLAEVVTGFTHQFFGVTTANGATSAYAGALIGVLYAAGRIARPNYEEMGCDARDRMSGS